MKNLINLRVPKNKRTSKIQQIGGRFSKNFFPKMSLSGKKPVEELFWIEFFFQQPHIAGKAQKGILYSV